MTLRFLHISDTHLDYVPNINYINTDEFINKKFAALEEAITYAVENNIKYIIHSGDVFDRIRPNIQYISRAMKLFYGAKTKGIKIILLSGNHDQPKIKDVFNSLKIFENLDNTKLFITNGIYTISTENEDYDIICIPSPYDWSNFSTTFKGSVEKQLEKSKSKNKILVTHIQMKNVIDKATNEVEPFIIDGITVNDIPNGFNYIALGHVHKMQRIENKTETWYAGSLTSLNFGDAGQDKYFLDVTITDNKETKVVPIKVNIDYSFLKYEIDLSKSLTNSDIISLISYYIKNEEIHGNIVKLTLYNCNKTILSVMNLQQIMKNLMQKEPLGIKIEIRKEEALEEAEDEELNKQISESLINPVSLEIQNYLKEKNIEEERIKEILALNDELLSTSKKENNDW